MPNARPTKRTGVQLYVQVRIANCVQPMLVPLMLHQVRVADHTFILKRYPRSFSGADAVSFFLTRRFARTEHEALAIGNALLNAGVFRHVKNEHLFRNGSYFYRFAAHEDYAAVDNSVTLRSSRMMSLACASFVSIPEIQRIDTAPVLHHTPATTTTTTTTHPCNTRTLTTAPAVGSGDATFFSFEDSLLTDTRPEFDEADVLVETGIRIAARVFPNLVGKFSDAKHLASDNVVAGKKYATSFTGRTAVKWLIRHEYANNVEEAIGIGNAMLASGVFYPLNSVDTSNGGGGGGFECSNRKCYRMIADTDISQELRRGARKDMLLKLLGINRAKAVGTKSAQQSPWFEEQMSFSFTSEHSGGGNNPVK